MEKDYKRITVSDFHTGELLDIDCAVDLLEPDEIAGIIAHPWHYTPSELAAVRDEVAERLNRAIQCADRRRM